MELKHKFNDVEIEIGKAPFGQSEPICIIVEQQNEKILFTNLMWNEAIEFAEKIKDKIAHTFTNGGSISWDGTNLTVIKDSKKISAQMNEQLVNDLLTLFFMRAIDPY